MAKEITASVPKGKDELLTKLQAQVKEYVTAEKFRLITERTFLKSILENSLGGPEAKEKRYDGVVVIENVKRLIGVSQPVSSN